jgi:hypothetical protein
MDGRFLTAFIIPEEREICGYKLKPYNLRHMLYLTAIESPFVCEKSDKCMTPEALLLALRICSTNDVQRALKERPTMREQILVGKMMAERDLFTSSLRELLDYIGDSNSVPVVFEKEDKGTPRKAHNAPPPLLMAVTLMAKLHLTKEEAWTLPVGQAIWYLTIYGIIEGAETKIITTEQEAKMDSEADFLKRLQAEALAKLQNHNGR